MRHTGVGGSGQLLPPLTLTVTENTVSRSHLAQGTAFLRKPKETEESIIGSMLS